MPSQAPKEAPEEAEKEAEDQEVQFVLSPAQQLVQGALAVEPYELSPLSSFSSGGGELWSPSGLVMAVLVFLAARAGRETAILSVRETSLDKLATLRTQLLDKVEGEKLKAEREAAAAAAAAEAALTPEERLRRDKEREAEAARIAEEAAARRLAQERQAQEERLAIQVNALPGNATT